MSEVWIVPSRTRRCSRNNGCCQVDWERINVTSVRINHCGHAPYCIAVIQGATYVCCPLTDFLPRKAPQESSSELTCAVGTDSTSAEIRPFLPWVLAVSFQYRFQRSLVPSNPLGSLVFEANWRRRGLLHAYYKFRQTIARPQQPTKLPQ